MQNNESTPMDSPETNVGNTGEPGNRSQTPEDAALADLANEDLLNSASKEQPMGNGGTAGTVDLNEALSNAEARSLRAQAELENFRKRSRRERDEERKYAALPVVRDLLPVIDNLKRATDAAGESGEASGLAEGVKMVVSQMMMVLGQHHCTEIASLGTPFDPMFQEAVAQRPSDEAAGTVIEVATTGYKLHDRVVRPAQVVVSQGPGEAS